MIEFFGVGILAGMASGFFGIGGGIIVVPMLVMLGLGIKSAIGLSAMQMTFSSFYGTWVHSKSGLVKPRDFWQLGLGGVAGASFGAWLLTIVDAHIAALTFCGMMILALIRTVFINPEPGEQKTVHGILFFLAGAFVGTFSGLVGVGGGFLLVPLLAGFMGIPFKQAIAIGLYFVMFVGTAAFITLSSLGYVDFYKGLFLSAGSLIGVRLGIWIAAKTSAKKHKGIVIVLYTILLGIMIYKIYRGDV